jgi:hypothetical protein
MALFARIYHTATLMLLSFDFVSVRAGAAKADQGGYFKHKHINFKMLILIKKEGVMGWGVRD